MNAIMLDKHILDILTDHKICLMKQQLLKCNQTVISQFEYPILSGGTYVFHVRHRNTSNDFINSFSSTYGRFTAMNYIMEEIYRRGETGCAYHIPTLSKDADDIKECLRETTYALQRLCKEVLN